MDTCLIAEGKAANDQAELVYQVMLFNDKGDDYIILIQAKKNMETYKKIAKIFKREQEIDMNITLLQVRLNCCNVTRRNNTTSDYLYSSAVLPIICWTAIR